jgi:flagellar biosynthesis protein FliP
MTEDAGIWPAIVGCAMIGLVLAINYFVMKRIVRGRYADAIKRINDATELMKQASKRLETEVKP